MEHSAIDELKFSSSDFDVPSQEVSPSCSTYIYISVLCITEAHQRIASPSRHLWRARCTFFSEHHLLICLLRFLSRAAANIVAVELDYKLLLGMQYECNVAGIVIPWENIGRLMGPHISGSAVIQHLAKTRSRMVAKGLSVPPPLRRGGGGSRFSTTATPSNLNNPTATAPTGPTTNAPANKKTNAKANKNSTKSKKASQYSDESDEDDYALNGDDSDAEYGQARAKRAKKNGKGPTKRKVKTEDSDEDAEAAIEVAKPKTKKSKSPSGELSAYGYTDINGVPIDDGIYSDDETDAMVGAGAPWLSLDNDGSYPNTGDNSKKSLIVSLPTTPTKMDTPFANDDTEEEALGGEFNSIINADQSLGNDFDFHNPYQNSEDYVSTLNQEFGQVDGHSGALSSDGGFGSNTGQAATYPTFNNDGDFGSNMGQAATYPSFNNNGGFNSNIGQAVPYPIQTSWPNNHGVASSSNYTSVNQTPAGTSAGAEYGMDNFDENEYNFESSFDNSGYDFDSTSNLFNTDNVDGNFCGGDFFSGNYYGN